MRVADRYWALKISLGCLVISRMMKERGDFRKLIHHGRKNPFDGDMSDRYEALGGR